ncbi:hypothetical protein JY651_44250 [Pyxidicoccus parkwayensis]|uniref:Uncharacterized protein n=1 Tax=Pyxidicoccus parkwayensis TaxID=2813578 RepID=A0ABX7NT57_9BACT|nr:hypothetical protein [Pyxidicoccus parkwaysis]QSQ22079.1 hypothetical protein JY651_44250 [Pyxidicoccus parkwaysis]
MTVVTQKAGAPVTPEGVLQQILCECHQKIQPKEGDTCASLGEAKHECCDKAIQNHKAPPHIDGERGYASDGTRLSQSRAQLKASGTSLKGTLWPDACSTDAAGNPTQFFDFKFVCPGGTQFYDRKTGEVRFSRGKGNPGADFYFPAGKSQYDRYLALSEKLGMTQPPKPLTSQSC